MAESGGSWRDSYKGMSSDNIKGLVLALSSSLFIGASFIVKKKGLKKAASTGTRAGVGGYSYLYEPLWWIGMTTMLLGEIANFAAYAFAPAILVTPLGAVSIIISAVLAHIILREKLHIFGILGCALCVVGSTTIVLHAPQEQEIDSVIEVWNLATEPGALLDGTLILHLHVLCESGNWGCCISHYPFCPPIWANKRNGLYWYLLACGIIIGHECKSTWNSIKADIFWNKSVILSTNMDIHLGRTYLCDNPIELLKQGS
ncbi:unnamed protein product [Arabidopsis lyrata]|nr:unnamed protein product [Arabidopsis lyrata]